ncbi:DUF397 domain-containing protein [Streptoalloteichus hindustanus]|uniref:DUF397 domain-containing protein n=1 Tax=Streptoalloteichus hindustanus TaxID=2017 RepID=A0A1M5NC66_STRHI|nr:DUF397 domain-containing protein [Streptoalloteichus hindustanus]SHG86779.1 protein of unknown function [Streptoalloteichus hindustanus]
MTQWRESSQSSGSNGNCVEIAGVPAGATWRKSSHSGGGNANCVEVASGATGAAVRDSKNPGGAALVFGAGEFAAFVRAAKEGRLDLG